MFSGIIECVGHVRSASLEGTALRLTVATNFVDLTLGESIATNGVCLTVAGHDARGEAGFFVSPETLKRSNLSRLRTGARVNLERSVTLATRLSGHLVQGHVDGKAALSSIEEEGEARRLLLSLPKALHPFCVEKGSIALNGVSLTLNEVGAPDDSERFAAAITIIPYTWEHTNLQFCALDEEINVEVDVLAKYVERLCRVYLK